MSNYIIRQDGDSWFCSTDDFVNLQESEVAFGDSPTDALWKFLQLQDDAKPHICHYCRSTRHDTDKHQAIAEMF